MVALETIQHLLEADLGQENYGHLRYAAQSVSIFLINRLEIEFIN